MTQVASRFTTAGTELERAGGPPLLAVALYSSDGHLAQASVVDPLMVESEATRRSGDYEGGTR